VETPGIDELERKREQERARKGNSAYDEPIAEPRPWPDPPQAEAFHGLAGDIVRAIEPHTEADPVALLAHILVGYGSMIGNAAYFAVESTRHTANEFVVLVGRSSKGRKGTSEGRIRHVLGAVDDGWNRDHVVSGLSSGEGLIHAVRDPVHRVVRDRKTGLTEDEITDEGVSDKRLLVTESEWASTLRVLVREGNTLSPVVRRAWDDGNLRTLTKNAPEKATGAHVSIIGHVTEDELRAYLDRTEAANGYGNRHLFLCVKRSRVLPFGGEDPGVGELVVRLHRAVDHGRGASRLEMDGDAARCWERVYPELSAERDGLFGAVVARAEAHVVRLALTYALLDCSAVIQLEHLLAALALWRYAEDSAHRVFGDAIGDRVADTILDALRRTPDGMTRTDIRDLFGKHESRTRIADALSRLLQRGKARRETEQTGGRATERWFAV
jgi:hypothetical protein